MASQMAIKSVLMRAAVKVSYWVDMKVELMAVL